MSGRSLGGNYRRLWTAGVVSNLGDGLAVVAYPWLASSITRSPAALALGSAEVLRDNAAQTLLPSIVATEDLERANGRMWGAEMVMNAFVGPPLARVLIGISLALPFLVDAGTFALAPVDGEGRGCAWRRDRRRPDVGHLSIRPVTARAT